jgi:hypothetical protein
MQRRGRCSNEDCFPIVGQCGSFWRRGRLGVQLIDLVGAVWNY